MNKFIKRVCSILVWAKFCWREGSGELQTVGRGHNNYEIAIKRYRKHFGSLIKFFKLAKLL